MHLHFFARFLYNIEKSGITVFFFLPTVREELLQRGRKLSAHSLWQMLLPNYGGVSGKRWISSFVFAPWQ